MQRELDLMTLIASGIDPRDGSSLNVTNSPLLKQARDLYIEVIKASNCDQGAPIKKARPGDKWEPYRQAVIDCWNSSERVTSRTLVDQFGRRSEKTDESSQADLYLDQLCRWGLFPDPTAAKESDYRRRVSSGIDPLWDDCRPWVDSVVHKCRQMWQEGKSSFDMSMVAKRGAWQCLRALVKLGLFESIDAAKEADDRRREALGQESRR